MTELVIAGIHALLQQTDVMPALLKGVQTGLQTAIHILPTMIVLLTAVRMLRASGWIDLAGQMLEPLLQKTGIPAECSALVLLKPLSAAGWLWGRRSCEIAGWTAMRDGLLPLCWALLRPACTQLAFIAVIWN